MTPPPDAAARASGEGAGEPSEAAVLAVWRSRYVGEPDASAHLDRERLERIKRELSAAYAVDSLARPAGGVPSELEAMKRRYLAACRMVTALNYGKRDWTLCVPARPEHDPDLVIQAALDDLEILLMRAAASPAGGPPGEREWGER